jgi:uncharacterized protein (TIGR00369 family)
MTEPLDGSIFGPNQPCFGCSPGHPNGFHLRFEREGDEVVTRFTPGTNHQGPPGVMHGGLVMTLADEIAAWAIIAATGKFGFTASVECRLKKPVRVGAEVVGRGRIVKDGRRVVDTSVSIWQHGQVCAEATLRFVLLDRGGAEALLGVELPEEWQRFSR